jgi:hypothetical protein
MNQWQLKKTIPCRHAKGMALALIKKMIGYIKICIGKPRGCQDNVGAEPDR